MVRQLIDGPSCSASPPPLLSITWCTGNPACQRWPLRSIGYARTHGSRRLEQFTPEVLAEIDGIMKPRR